MHRKTFWVRRRDQLYSKHEIGRIILSRLLPFADIRSFLWSNLTWSIVPGAVASDRWFNGRWDGRVFARLDDVQWGDKERRLEWIYAIDRKFQGIAWWILPIRDTLVNHCIKRIKRVPYQSDENEGNARRVLCQYSDQKGDWFNRKYPNICHINPEIDYETWPLGAPQCVAFKGTAASWSRSSVSGCCLLAGQITGPAPIINLFPDIRIPLLSTARRHSPVIWNTSESGWNSNCDLDSVRSPQTRQMAEILNLWDAIIVEIQFFQ